MAALPLPLKKGEREGKDQRASRSSVYQDGVCG
jgi:hypothetical protein